MRLWCWSAAACSTARPEARRLIQRAILASMTPLLFVLATFFIALAAGTLGSILGLGGGIIVVPALTILLHVDIRLAIGASIIAVIATSSGAAAASEREHLTKLRGAM